MSERRRRARTAGDGARAARDDAPSRRCLALRTGGHVYAYAYAPEYERAALEAFAMCPGADPAEVLAVVCYLGYDPRTLELGLD